MIREIFNHFLKVRELPLLILERLKRKFSQLLFWINKIIYKTKSLFKNGIDHIFEPKNIIIKKLSVYVIKNIDNTYKIESLTSNNLKTKNFSVQEALNYFSLAVTDYKNRNTSNTFIPIFCLERLDPSIEGIQAILLHNLTEEIEKDFMDLKLNDPINIRTNDRGRILKGFIDFGTDRILFYGKPEKVLSFLKTIFQRFDFSLEDYASLHQKMKDLYRQYFNEPLGTRSIIGYLGVIFTVVVGLLFNKITSEKVEYAILIGLILSLLTFIAFMLIEAFEDKIIAMSPNWTNPISLINWLMFLTFLIFGSIFFLSTIETFYLVIVTQLLSIIIVIMSILKTLVEILFEDGISKKTIMFLWLFLLFINILFIDEVLTIHKHI